MPAVPRPAVLLGLLAACSAAGADPGAYPELDGPGLSEGRSVWMANCEGCHGYGFGGAPVPMRPRDWEARLARGKALLYEHAINGFFGPDDTLMPERGGNPQLSDAQVRAAVDYMTALATYYIQQQR